MRINYRYNIGRGIYIKIQFNQRGKHVGNEFCFDCVCCYYG